MAKRKANNTNNSINASFPVTNGRICQLSGKWKKRTIPAVVGFRPRS